MSVERAYRTGPTGFDSSEWHSAANRVIPPSTPSSNTTSAWLRPIWGRALGALSIFTTRTGRLDRRMSIGSPVSGDVAVVGGAGTAGGGPATVPAKPGGSATTVGAGVVFGFGRVVAVVDDVAPRVVVVEGFGLGRVVVVVDVEVVVGGGWTVSTRTKSVPQAVPATSSRTGSTARTGLRCRCGGCPNMSTGDGTGSARRTGGPREAGGGNGIGAKAATLRRRLDQGRKAAEASQDGHPPAR